jgi:carbonic anhydrase
MSGIDDLLAGNVRFAASFSRADLPIVPAKGTVVVTCMDARVDPGVVFDLDLGDVFVLRCVGGRVTADIEAQLGMLGALMTSVPASHPDVVVMHHTKCGTARFGDPDLRERAALMAGVDGAAVDAVVVDDPRVTVAADVATLRERLPGDVRIVGLVYDLETGRAQPV